MLRINMLQAVIKRKKPVVICFVAILVAQILAPAPLLALTNGPTQPEFTGFSAVGSSDMVNLFTGDLNYNLPLFELPGPGGSYPFTLSYQSGITMDQESSWVGLGWSLNPGAISRQMRGLPDEFSGDLVTTVSDMKPNVTWEFGINADVELIAFPKNKPSFGIRFSHNTHMGWDAGVNLGLPLKKFCTSPFAFEATLSTSVIEGATASAGFNISSYTENSNTKFNVGTSINSRQGLTMLSFGYNHSIKGSEKKSAFSFGNQGSISFEQQSFIPSITQRYIGTTFGASVEGGVLAVLPHIGGRVNVQFSSSEFQRRGLPVTYQSFGFLNFKSRKQGQTFLTDINRANEGALHRYSENLAIPSTTPDLFVVTGASLNATFRAYRSDVGILTDPNLTSIFAAANLGFDMNFGGVVDVGVNGGATFSQSSSRNWPIDNKSIETYNFTTDSINSDYQPFVFRIPGTISSDSLNANDYIHGDNTLRVDLIGDDIPATTILQKENGQNFPIEQGARKTRRVAATSIKYITNKELRNGTSGLWLPEFTAWIHNSPPEPARAELNRDNDPDHHIAGFEILNTDGLRYVYGLPVKNKFHREEYFSVSAPSTCVNEVDVPSDEYFYKVSGTEEFYQKKELPDYNHSHLLTAILGQDYVDIDRIPGPSDGDLGFWVRFEYEKKEDFGWRAPYEGASYLPGNLITDRDDKASVLHGVRELYYLKVAETRTHRAEFTCVVKPDGKGAPFPVSPTENVSGESWKLDAINLYAKFDAPLEEVKAIKRIKFSYDESLCEGVPNGSLGGGKTTLTKVQFSYEKSVVGLATPYEFEYSSINPDYDTRNQDRWGKYQALESDCHAQAYSFTKQNATEANSNAGAWALKKITLPSGSEINISYESDQYMYVQNREVMQMFPITGFGPGEGDTIIQDVVNGPFKVFFNPGTENPISTKQDIIPFLKHIHGLQFDRNGDLINSGENQIFFKANMGIIDATHRDYVSGYAKITGFDVQGGKPYLILAPFTLSGKDYHPFSAAAWQKMKLEYPHAISTAEFEDDNQSFMEVIGLFAASLNEIGGIFTSFFTTCKNRDIATTIKPELSYIRLTYPGSGKYGGDSRVSEITLNDNWGSTITLGQTYEYTTIDSTGTTISSGVAENEPLIGYEECPLRYAKLFHKQIPIHTSEDLMFEYPVNQSYLPQASIGYSKVTVRSKATALQKNIESSLPDNFSTTGRTVHEFYTAKDFPIKFGETGLEKHLPPKAKWNTLFSNTQHHVYSGSQGYSIILNDMHGKPLRVTHYGEDKMNNESSHFTTKTEYTYFEGGTDVTDELGVYRSGRTLDNEVMAFLDYASDPEDDKRLHVEPMEFGVEREFFVDMRESKTEAQSAQFGPNVVFSFAVSFFGIPIPLPGFHANLTSSGNKTRTVVTNKVIRKSGILKQVDVYDGQSHLRTNNLVFDKITGQPVLTSVNNVFDQKIYALNLPAHYVYNGMGGAYDNIRLSFEASFDDDDDCTGWHNMTGVDDRVKGLLRKDDELLIMQDGLVIGTAIIQDTVDGVFKCSSVESSTNTEYECLVIRSGSRNLLNESILQLSSINNPVTNIELDDELTFNVQTDYGAVQTSIHPVLVDSVISASASTYQRVAFIPNVECPNIAENIIRSGISATGGNHWVPKASYIYTDDRNLSSLRPGDELTLRKEGLVENVPLFDYTTPFFTHNTTGGKWLETAYHLQTEPVSNIMHSQNAIGVSSSSFKGYADQDLYAAFGNVPVLASENALPTELAFEGFEESSWSNNNVNYGFVTSNFTFGNGFIPIRYEKYRLLGGMTWSTPTVPCLVLAKEYDALDELPAYIELNLKNDIGQESSYIICDVSLQTSIVVEPYYESFRVPFANATKYVIDYPDDCPSFSGLFTGEATLVFEMDEATGVGTQSSAYAHTGSHSFHPDSSFQREQTSINLVGGKEYLFEGWILMADAAHKDLPTYPDTWFVQISDNGSTYDVKPIGDIIEGWQQIQCKFTASGAPVFIKFNTSESPDIYFDDIRLSPLDAAVKSYVYDPNKLRLIAELDENNFATFYHYGDDGKLVLIRKETERGIMTIQESRNHLHSN